MNESTLEALFFVPRASTDRRSASGIKPPPYFTEEGMVMFDRRENGERRKAKQQAAEVQANRKAELAA